MTGPVHVYIAQGSGHPHAGESGVLTGKSIDLLKGKMYEVKLDACVHGVEGCFAKVEDLREEKRAAT